jgi:sphingomyelin phosphodiesterase
LNDPTRATSIAYVGGSITTFNFLNPGYRIYTVDGIYADSTWQVLDLESSYMNLTYANLYNKPTIQKEYSAKAN